MEKTQAMPGQKAYRRGFRPAGIRLDQQHSPQPWGPGKTTSQHKVSPEASSESQHIRGQIILRSLPLIPTYSTFSPGRGSPENSPCFQMLARPRLCALVAGLCSQRSCPPLPLPQQSQRAAQLSRRCFYFKTPWKLGHQFGLPGDTRECS